MRRSAGVRMVSYFAGLIGSGVASAAGSAAGVSDDVFTLGQITVTASRIHESFGDSSIDKDEIWRFDTNSLDQAIKLVPGVTATQETNGRRNERDIFVRGFGRLQVPLTIDGVRIYLPADNRLDMGRFLTPDLAEIQIQKGYVPVTNGPGGLGGAINLVTRKPTRPFESEVQLGTLLGRDAGYDGWNGYARIGTRTERFYAQLSGAYLDRDSWPLSSDFRPTAMEDGGDRNGSANRDSRINAKFGYVPNETDEYSLSYTKQEGSKEAPLHVNNSPPVPPNSYWTWPWWDIENLYWLSNTQVGEQGYLKTRFFYNKFENGLYAWDDATYTTQSANGRFQSIYDDDGYGGSIEVGLPLLPNSSTRVSAHFRRDQHVEFNINRPTSAAFRNVEPRQKTREETWSIAVENSYAVNDALEIRAGISYDSNEILVAEEFNATRGMYLNPVGGSHSLNGQAAVSWRYADDASLSASVSSRARFPTLFERYSTRFGSAVPNPDLESERATSFDLTWERRFDERGRFSVAAFYADVSNMIQTVVVAPPPNQLTQAQNVGDGENYGLELSGELRVGEQLLVGGNYTWMQRRIRDPLQPALRPLGTPTHQGLLFATWETPFGLSLTPSVEFADSRWSDVTGGGYREVGAYTLVNLQAQYRFNAQFAAAIGGRNLLDRNYVLADGLPEPGRTLYAKLQFAF
ncbi:MAG: TonB-dependent receptor [Sinobacteraceae bacterium]|nr:TonB-dependent receptor [Nevskiaceae bacterium]